MKAKTLLQYVLPIVAAAGCEKKARNDQDAVRILDNTTTLNESGVPLRAVISAVPDTLRQVSFADTSSAPIKAVPTPSLKTAAVKISQPTKSSGAINKYTDGRLELFYPRNDWSLRQNDRADLMALLTAMPDSKIFVVEGHADYVGSTEDNAQLSENRAQGVADFIRRQHKTAELVSYGESQAQQSGNARDTAKDRRVTVIPNAGILTLGLAALPADYYLIDQSESMSNADGTGKSKWEQVRDFPYPKQSKVFTFSTALSFTPPGLSAVLKVKTLDCLG